MDIKFTAFLYSKFSQNSKKFTELLERIPQDFKSNIKLNILCVDNEKIRKTVLNSKQFDIKNVPCLLITYNDGHVEKFEGPDAFKWADDVILKITHKQQIEQQQFEQQQIEQQKIMQQQMLQQQMLQQQQQQQQIIPEQNKQTHQKKNTKKSIAEEELEEIEDDEEEHQNIKKKKVKSVIKNSKIKGKTSIDDIETEDESETIEDDLQKEIQKHPQIQQKEVTNALNSKKESLMSAAMAMQKTRESYDKNLKNPQMMNLGR